MKKAKILSAILTVVMAAQLFTATASAKVVTGISGAPEKSDFVQPLSIKAEPKKGNRLPLSSFDEPDCLLNWTVQTHHSVSRMRIEWLKDENGGYLRTDNRKLNYFGFRFTPLFTYSAGIYKFTGYFRTYNENEITSLRIEFKDDSNNVIGETLYVNCGNDWQKVEYYLVVPDNMKQINICGAGYVEFTQDFCMDEFSLVAVDEIPAGFNNTNKFGPEVDRAKAREIMYENAGISAWDEDIESRYTVNGLMMNHDADGLLHSVGRDPDSVTVQDIVDLAMQYEGSMVTDMMICVNNIIATYPSLVWTSYLDKYYQTEENGIAVNYTETVATKGARHLFETLNLDYIGLWCELFSEMGINPWISYRMNDAHDLQQPTSFLLSDFFHENPQLRRIQHHTSGYRYMDNLLNYTYEESRDHMLALINESLSRYNCYGIELDFQREAFLWHIGGEYNGLDILNGFMRDVNNIVAIYEEKYGHEIKVAARVPSDPMTNYELGLDVVTWAAEGLVDHVTASGRFETTDTDIPIRLWKSLLAPHGVTLAASIDTSYIEHHSAANTSGLTLEIIAGIAANAYSQGADKMYYMNYNTTLTEDGPVIDEDKVTITRESTVDGYGDLTGSQGKWLVWNTIGSYDKCIELTRRCIPTYNDTKPVWRTQYYNEIVPFRVNPGSTQTLRVPVGDVTEGTKLTLMISGAQNNLSQPPTVYVNSRLCTFEGVGNSLPTRSGIYTEDMVMLYDIPVEAHDETYMVIEIDSEISLYVNHLEIYVQPGAK